jgi:hypothetical protein
MTLEELVPAHAAHQSDCFGIDRHHRRVAPRVAVCPPHACVIVGSGGALELVWRFQLLLRPLPRLLGALAAAAIWGL